MEGHAPYRGLLTHGFTVDGQGRKMSKSLGNYMPLAESANKYGGEILRLWCAATDYSGDLAIDDKILARVIDAYRRIRNTLRFLLANTSDFDAAKDAVPLPQMLEIDRWALARAAQLQNEIVGEFDAAAGVFKGGHYGIYEFHPVVSKLQIYCSEDLGAFYLDILKDRLYTTAPKSLARRSAQTALWHITHAMLRWMAPFLSFTAEEAWKMVSPQSKASIFTETYWTFPAEDTLWQPDGRSPKQALDRWLELVNTRDFVNRELESVRTQGRIRSSLQAEVTLRADVATIERLASFGDDLKFLLIVSKVGLEVETSLPALEAIVLPSAAPKCERCWHYRDDVGYDPAHPTICGRCTSNLYGEGERRTVA